MDVQPSTWKEVVRRLRQIGRDDIAFVNAGLHKDRQQARAIAADLYVRYMLVGNELTTCHDSIIQSQIRILIKKMLMCIYGRILELKNLLIDEDLSIYTPIIDQLSGVHVTYEQFELIIPRCFRNERRSFLDDIDGKIDEIYNRIRIENENSSETTKEESEEHHSNTVQVASSAETINSSMDVISFKNVMEQKMPERFTDTAKEKHSREMAIKLLQRHIRAIRDRIIGNELLANKRTRDNIITGKYIKSISKQKALESAIKIQRYWRLYRKKRQENIKTQKLNILIGVQMSSDRIYYGAQREREEDKIRIQQAKADADFKNAIIRLQEKLNRHTKIEIVEDIEDELRGYVWSYFDMCKHLPSWPDPTPIMFTGNDILGLPPINVPKNILRRLRIPDKFYPSALSQRVPLGGSAIFHTGRWMSMEMAEILAPLIVEFEKMPARERKLLTKELAEKRKSEKQTAIQNAKDIVDEREKERAFGVVPEPSDLTEWFKEALDEFDSNWIVDDDFDNQPREQLINADLFAKAKVELRATVDETIKEELERLKASYARDSKKKYKKPKKKSSKKERAKKKKKSTLPSPKEIFEELVRGNMIKKSVTSKFDDFHGEVNYSGSALRGEPYFIDSPYGLGDIRQIVKELCVIGLTFAELRTLKQIKIGQSLLIAGPEKSGKTMLTNAVCTESGSLKIELNFKNLSENYHSKKRIIRLIKIILELVKIYQPVVIEVDFADVLFYRKTPENFKLYNPKLMKFALTKLTKAIKKIKTERVLVIGKATKPWLTAGKKITNVFETIVFTVPDYNTIFMLLNGLIMSYPAVNREFPVTVLASLLAGYPRYMVTDIVANVMTTERILTLRNIPLNVKEFDAVMKNYPVHKADELCNQYYNWYRKSTSLGARKALQMIEKMDKYKSEGKKKKLK